MTRSFNNAGFNSGLPEPLLVVGNPPWATNAELSTLGSSNLPAKANLQGHRGLDAITGKSNFDISEWMLIRVLESLDGRKATMAMLCKSAVARKVLVHAWRKEIGLRNSMMYHFDAMRYFGASVDACLLVCCLSPLARSHDCKVHERLNEQAPAHTIGYRDGQLVAQVALHDRWKHLRGEGTHEWRSGVKHDCAKVMELRREGSRYRNGLGEMVEIEDEYVFPLLKSADLASSSIGEPARWIVVPQRSVADETGSIKHWAPKTWKYLEAHAELLDQRASRIYKKRPRFSVFGVGPYSFAPWKVAISGLHKKLGFRVVGSVAGKPVMLDDTSYFLPCRTEPCASRIASMLNSQVAREFLEAFIFWDAKRPITVELLRRLDLRLLARQLGVQPAVVECVSEQPNMQTFRASSSRVQGRLWGIEALEHQT